LATFRNSLTIPETDKPSNDIPKRLGSASDKAIHQIIFSYLYLLGPRNEPKNNKLIIIKGRIGIIREPSGAGFVSFAIMDKIGVK
jgi:hypothetical protein